ncbi:MAG TPA: hypothetical protein VMH88_02885 [Gemmatimonadales bacterium]|nr:hypothetical protein [Gemmatimonadales bacterium]
MPNRVYLSTKDLYFKAKLREVAAQLGADLASEAAAGDVAVVELDDVHAPERIRELTHRGVRVLAFGQHERADLLREAREAGAEAVPNSLVENRLRALLRGDQPPSA